jgi:rod shape-determining protein MreD
MKAIAVIAGLALAVLFQTTLGGIALQAGTHVNFVLVAVIFIALALGPVSGLLAGTVGGIAQDAIAGGIVGIGGISKTIVGFVVGIFGAQFIVSQPFPRLVIFVAGTFVHELCFQSLYALAEAHSVRIHYREVLIQALVNGLVGIAVFYVMENAPGMMQRREARRASFGRRRFF